MNVLSSPAQARIQAAAPKWEAEAVVEGKITKISLDDYKGLCGVFFSCVIREGKYLVFFFYPLDLFEQETLCCY